MEPFAGTDLDLFRNHFTASFHHQEKSLDAQGTVYWITGLSGSGKTTIGEMFTRELKRLGRPTAFLDGDEIRNVLGNDIGHSADDRRISAMRNSRLCRMIAKQGVDVVCGTISMFHECRQWNRANIQNYREIYLKVPMEVLRKRDPKQIYSRTDRGEMKNVYGIDLKWDEPDSSDVTITNDGSTTPESVVAQLLSELVDKSQMQR
ncbi:MAG: adenylyl-sulfate kinase [Proteobacteria bacterium]|nr:adenylyl-sulfate kinase [Pseudomonadota bacterium]